MAHAIFVAEAEKRRLRVQAYSAGIFDFTDLPPFDETTRTCLYHNTPPPKEESTWVRNLPLNSIDRFLVMEQYHADALIRDFGVLPNRVTLLGEFDPRKRGTEIGDPISRSRAVFKTCYEQIRDCVINYLDTTSDL